jgi:hypothetical protein
MIIALPNIETITKIDPSISGPGLTRWKQNLKAMPCLLQDTRIGKDGK